MKALDFKTCRRPTYGDGHRWGHWRFNKPALCLEYRAEGKLWRYEVDLTRCRTSAQILDWLCQVGAKTWVSAEDIGHLLMAIDNLAGRLQSRVCGCGVESGPIDWEKLMTSGKESNGKTRTASH